MTEEANHTVLHALNGDFATCAITLLKVALSRRPQIAVSRCAEPSRMGLREQSWPLGRRS